MTIENLFKQNSDNILKSTEEYNKKMELYGDVREQIEKELNLTNEQKEKLEKAFDLAFEAEYLLHRQCFVKGFKMARDLLMS